MNACHKANLQRLQRRQEESAEEEEMTQQIKMKIMKDVTKKIRSKGRMDAKNRWWVTELLAADSVDPSRMGRHHAEIVRVVGRDEKEGRDGKDVD